PEIFDEFRSVYGLLSERFGELRSAYVAIVQARSWTDNPGWRFTSNQAVVAANTPGLLSMKSPISAASFGHEIAHLSTIGATGPAQTFLSEGWAVWAESAIIENHFGADTAKEFWKRQANIYLFAYDGKTSLLEDDLNAGVAYVKGPLIFHMLEDA